MVYSCYVTYLSLQLCFLLHKYCITYQIHFRGQKENSTFLLQPALIQNTFHLSPLPAWSEFCLMLSQCIWATVGAQSETKAALGIQKSTIFQCWQRGSLASVSREWMLLPCWSEFFFSFLLQAHFKSSNEKKTASILQRNKKRDPHGITHTSTLV